MRSRAAITVLVVLASACGSAGGSPTGGGDYFAQLERTSQNAHIQERGLARQLRVRVERAATPAERLEAIEITLDQRVRLYEDVTDALSALRPVEGLEVAHDAYVTAWQAGLELTRKVRDSGIRSVPRYLATFEARAFRDMAAGIRRTCEDLETIAASAERPVDLACTRRPA